MIQFRSIIVFFLIICTSFTLFAKESAAAKKTATSNSSKKGKSMNPVVLIQTNKGPIEVEVWEDKAPISAKNFLEYVDNKFYDGTIFHRVIDGFMVQGGGMTSDMKEKDSKNAPIKNEASAELQNLRGTLAMARTMVVDSATNQFFINLVDNEFLNHKGKTPQNYGYAVFGKVVKGMETVDAIAKVSTGNSGFHQDVPKEPVIIESARRK